jgi:signal transduction histidine kinase
MDAETVTGPPLPPPSAADRGAVTASERLFLRAFAFVRLASLLQTTAAGIIAWEWFRHPTIVVVLLVVALFESILVVEVSRHQGVVGNTWLVAVDVTFSVIALSLTNWDLRPGADPFMHSFLYPYTVASIMLVGLSLRRVTGVLLLPLLVAGTYVGTVTGRFGFKPLLIQNSLTYWAFSLVSWALAQTFRKLSGDLDDARLETLKREVELARERERARNFRQLHDRVLQTMEIMGRDGWIGDERARQHIVQEANWLRRLIESGLRPGPDCLATALEAVIERQAATGLQIDLNSAAMEDEVLPEEVTSAIADAVNEALTNVRKHAGVTSAVVRAAPARDGVVVTVLDHGRGFDAAAVGPGLGIPESLDARMRQVGGTVRIETAPSAGTYVELWAPRT